MAPPNIFDKVNFSISLLIMAATTGYSVYWLVYLLKNSTFKWVQFMLFLCVVQNVNSCWLICLYYASATTFLQEH